MSTLKVEIVKVKDVQHHPNADRLSCITVKGWNVITAKNDDGSHRYKPGDLCVYIPEDSVIDTKLETYLFGPDSKITLEKGRIKIIKLRKVYSQGMCVELTTELEAMYPGITSKQEGEDVTALLNIVKYEPPEPPVGMRGSQDHWDKDFKKYTDIENIKNFTDVFKTGDIVSVTEKIHLSNFRCYLKLRKPQTFMEFLLSLVGKKFYKFCVGSHNVQLKAEILDNLWTKAAKQYDLKNKLRPGEAIYGEVGQVGTQKNYAYGMKPGEIKLWVFDVMVDGKYLDYEDFVKFCSTRNLPRVPELYVGPYSEAKINELKAGKSTIDSKEIKEGVVVKSFREEGSPYLNRKILKAINEEYLMQKNTDYH